MRAPLQKERAGSLPRFEFHRAQFTFDDERINEWRTNVVRVVEAFLDAVERDAVTTNENSCVNGFGRCQYFDVCTQPIGQRETMLATDMFTDYKSRVAVAAD